MSGNTRLETPPSLPQEDAISSSSSTSYSSDDLCDETDHLPFPSMTPILQSTLLQTASGSRYGASSREDASTKQEGHAGNSSNVSLPLGGIQCLGGNNDANTSVANSASSQSLASLVGNKDDKRAVKSRDSVMSLADENKTTLLSSGDSDDEAEEDEDGDFLGNERLPSDEEEIELSDDDNEEEDDSDDEDEDGDEEESVEGEEEGKEEEGKEEEGKEQEGEKEETVGSGTVSGTGTSEGTEKTESEEKGDTSDKQNGSPKDPKPEVSGKGKVSVGKKRKRATTKGRKEKKKKRIKVKKAAFERRNIRKLISENALDAGTLAAQMEELERKRRILELREKFQQQREHMQPRLSELQSLLDDEADDDPMSSLRPCDIQETLETVRTQQVIPRADDDIVLISSSEDDEEEDNDVVMVQSDHEDEDDGEEDINNSGSHINDEMNQPDAQGRILVNIGHPPDEPDIYLRPQIARVVKPHQIGGIRFLYDNLVEALARYKTSHGFGCVLAHSMGLGKTIQLVAFIDIFLRYTGAHHIMVIVPVNTLQNWMYEFNLWTPTADAIKPEDGCDSSSVTPREFDVHVLNDNHRTMVARAKVVNDWFKGGGVLLIGYEMYRLLTSRKFPAARGRKTKTKVNDPVIIDLVEEDQNKELLTGIHEALMRPGPDLVICDEGHRIKNSHAGISKALKNIRTRRRVVLTGYPLQNNLLEYWCMVDFVRPNFLGSRTEFSNMFERPIMNGQCLDSTPEDVRLMRFRAHVLHSLLEGFVQRRGHDVLTSTLPTKEEYTLLIRMSPVQRRLYTEFMGQVNVSDTGWVSTNPLKAFAICCKIWNHPDVLYTAAQKQKKNSLVEDNDIDLEEIQEAATGAKKGANKGGKTGPAEKNQSSPKPGQDVSKVYAMMDRKDQGVGYEWADELLKNYTPGVLENSGKMVLMMSLIDGAVKVNDKTLIFSQSLFTLDLIEEFLSKRTVPGTETVGEEDGKREEGKKWQKNVNYVRLDGSTSGIEREKLINQFNNTDNTAIHVFLLSTRAGCLGINLIGANRVIVFDASWNPCHDSQAVCRVYRYGQFKECFVYRLVTDNTMEKKIYDRQLNKQGISDRVVDELNPQNAFTRRQVDVLLQYQDQDLPRVDISHYLDEKCNDPVLTETLQEHHPWISREPFCHNKKSSGGTDQKLTKSEKQLARRSYEMEKRLNVNFRPNYSNFYPKNNPYGQLPPNPLGIKEVYPRNRPIASVPPIMSTPVPQRVRTDGQPGAGRFPVQAIMRPGVSVQQILTTTDIIVPGTNSTTNAQNSRIPAGENVLVIKTPRGVYLRTREGKIFAVRTTPKDAAVSMSESTAHVASSVNDTTMSGLSTLASMASTSTATSCSSYAVTAVTAAPPAAAAAAAAATTTLEKPDMTGPASSDEMYEGANGQDKEKVSPSLPSSLATPSSQEGGCQGSEKEDISLGKRDDSDVCVTNEKPGIDSVLFPGSAAPPPPFYNYPGLYGGYPGIMPPGSVYGTNTSGTSNAEKQKNHSSYASSNSYPPLNMPPADMMYGGYIAPPWSAANLPHHFPDFMQHPQMSATNSQNGKTEGQKKESWEGKEGSDASGSQDLFGENIDSVDESLIAFDTLLGFSNTNTSSSDSATTPTTRGSPNVSDWHSSGYGMPPYMTYPYGMPSSSGAGSIGGQMAYMQPLYHSHPSFMSGGYVHSMPQAGMDQSSYMPPIPDFNVAHSVEKMLQSVAGDSQSDSNRADKDTAQGTSTS